MADALPAALVPAAAPPAAPSPGTPAAVPGPVPWRGAWRELIAYLLGGFGLFLLFSFGLSYIFRQANILTSFVLYATNFLVFAGSAYFLGVRWRRQTWAQFGLRGFDPRWLLAALLLAAAVLPLRAVAALAAEALAGNGGALADMQPRLDIIAPSGPLALNFIITLFGAGILAPIAEELYFRGLLFSWFRSRFSFWPAVLISSTIFAAGHLDSVGVAASSFFLGLVLAIVFDRGRSLWLSIAIHIINNSLAVVLLYAAMLVYPKLAGP